MRQLTFLLILLFSISANAQKPDISVLKAIARLQENNYNTALELLQITENQESAFTLKLKGDCYYGLQDFKNALQYYQKADDLTDDIASLQIARTFAKLGNHSKALAWLEKYLGQKNKITEYALVTDDAFSEIDKTNEWKALWKKEWYSVPEIQSNAINSILKKGNGQSALNELENPQAGYIPKHEFFAFQAQAYILLKQWEPALHSIHQALALQKQNENYLEIRAQIYFQVSDYGLATSDYAKALSLNPYKPDLYLKCAESSRMAGNIDLATEYLTIYQQLYPENEATIYQLGKLESVSENYSQSINYFTRLIAMDPSNAQYYADRGSIFLQIENYQSADEDFGMALDLNPTLRDAYLNKGKIKLYLLDSEGACYNFEKAKSYGSNEASKLYTRHCLK
jgi:tetratricopeptide (TPR) repeat protein